MRFEDYLQKNYASYIIEQLYNIEENDERVTLPGIIVGEDEQYRILEDERCCFPGKAKVKRVWYRMGEVKAEGEDGKIDSYDFGFTVLIDVVFTFYRTDPFSRGTWYETRQYYVDCAADVDRVLRRFTVLRILDKNGRSDLLMRMLRKDGTLSNYPVRYLKDEELEERAESFLAKYYPAALEEPMRLPIADIITDHMGLNLAFDKLDPEGKTFGRIYFQDCMATVYTQGGETVMKNYCGGTIVTDLGIDLERNRGAFRFTMTHEACHWEWDRTTMNLLGILAGIYYLPEDSREETSDSIGPDAAIDLNDDNEPLTDPFPYPPELFRIMEQNADRTAARILIPRRTVENAIQGLLERQIHQDSGSTGKGRYLEDMVSTIAEFYGVSKQAMKIRMEGLGFVEFCGVLNYVDGRYIPAFSTKKGKQKSCINYLVEEDQLVHALSRRPSLLKLYIQGKVVFAEGKLTLNDKRYVTYRSGVPELTPYAREHVDECCFQFDLNFRRKGHLDGQGKEEAWIEKGILQTNPATEHSSDLKMDHDAQAPGIPYGTDGYLNRIDSACFMEASPRDDKKTQSLEEEAQNLDAIEYQFKFIVDTRDLVPGELGEAIKYHMKRLHITVDMLSERTGIEPRTLIRYRQGRTVPCLEDLIAVCIGMHLSPQFSFALLKKARYQLSDSVEDLGYELILRKYSQNSIPECNKILKRCGGGRIGKLDKYAV